MELTFDRVEITWVSTSVTRIQFFFRNGLVQELAVNRNSERQCTIDVSEIDGRVVVK